MDKTETRAVIRYFVKKGGKASEINKYWQVALGESAPSFATVYKWWTKFKHGPKSLKYDPRNGQPNTAKTHVNKKSR